MQLLSREPASNQVESALRRELYFFNLYRVLEASLLALVAFGPGETLIGPARHPVLLAATVMAYLAFAAIMMVWGRDSASLHRPALIGVIVDIGVAAITTHAAPDAASGISLMLVFNIGAAALLLPLRAGLGVAVLGFIAMLAEQLASIGHDGTTTRPLAVLLMFGVSSLAIATLTNLLGRRMQASEDLAERRGSEVANLAEVNELIIRRMRTGVLMVDADGHIRLANEAALALLGDAGGGRRALAVTAPELARRLQRWREDGVSDNTPLRLNADAEVLPRFARLLADSELSLIFLDDTSMLSRRAETISLAALGRFSASLAHEIRNPLAAISYAAQLLEESREISIADGRMLQIIRQQCVRMDGIVASVLGLARREHANPEHVELIGLLQRFADDYAESHPLDADTLEVSSRHGSVAGMIDPRHLQQILTVLVANARNYGRLPGEPARITLRVHQDDGGPAIDVLDRGPGIPEASAAQLFRPFHTTSEHGTGLGLYIARELAQANQGSLDYIRTPGGSCFRVRMSGPTALPQRNKREQVRN